MMHKHNELRKLKEKVARKRRQPIYSDEETEKLQEAEELLEEAADIAEQSKIERDGNPLRLYEDEYTAELHGNDLGLTLTEFELLQTLWEHSPKAFTRQQLVEKVFVSSDEKNVLATERTVDAHIKNLREKLGRYKNRIETIRGVGYRYTDEHFGETRD